MKTAFAALALFGLSLVGVAHAGPSSFPMNRTVPTQTESSKTADWMSRVAVRYGDLNLSRDADARFMLTRIEKAAATVCMHHSHDRNMARGLARMRTCEKTAVAQALAALKSPAVDALHAQRRAARSAGLFGFGQPRQVSAAPQAASR